MMPAPAVVDGLLGEQVADHGATHGAASIDDQHAAVAGFSGQLANQGVVFEALDGRDLAAELQLPTEVAEHRLADFELVAELIAKVGGSDVHGVVSIGMRRQFAPRLGIRLAQWLAAFVAVGEEQASSVAGGVCRS